MRGGVARQGSGFGDILRRYRVAAGLTQEALAERAAMSARGISGLERGARTHPYPATVRRLAVALALSDADRTVLERAWKCSLSTARPAGSSSACRHHADLLQEAQRVPHLPGFGDLSPA